MVVSPPDELPALGSGFVVALVVVLALVSLVSLDEVDGPSVESLAVSGVSVSPLVSLRSDRASGGPADRGDGR